MPSFSRCFIGYLLPRSHIPLPQFELLRSTIFQFKSKSKLRSSRFGFLLLFLCFLHHPALQHPFNLPRCYEYKYLLTLVAIRSTTLDLFPYFNGKLFLNQTNFPFKVSTGIAIFRATASQSRKSIKSYLLKKYFDDV